MGSNCNVDAVTPRRADLPRNGSLVKITNRRAKLSQYYGLRPSSISGRYDIDEAASNPFSAVTSNK